MILLSGRPFDTSSLANEYPENSVEQQLLHAMSEGAGRYNYDSLNQLKFELLLRKEIVNAAIALYKSRLSFAVFHKSKANPEYWDRTENGGFRLKQGAEPAAAIEDIFKNSSAYATECATAMVIVYYRALLNVFGKERFNELFPEIYLMNWHIEEPLLREIGTPKPAADILLGDRGYFSNPDVNPETPQWVGENVIVLPDSLYYGHGIGITTADRIIASLNDNRRTDATQSATFLDSAGRPNFKRLSDLYHPSSARPDPLVWRPFPPPISARR